MEDKWQPIDTVDKSGIHVQFAKKEGDEFKEVVVAYFYSGRWLSNFTEYTHKVQHYYTHWAPLE